MNTAVHFEERRNGVTEAMLGVVAIATIVPVDHHELRAGWMMHLPPWAPRWTFEADIDAAKAAVRARVQDWLDITGLGTKAE